MRNGLGAVDQGGDAAGLGGGNNAAHRQNGAQRIRDMGAGEELGAGAHQGNDRFQMDLALCVHRRHHEFGAGLLAYHLPGHDVRVVFQMSDQDFIAGPQQRPRIALRHQVDRFGGSAQEDDFVARARVDEARQAISRALVQGRGFLAQGVHAAMNIGVVMPFVVIHCIDHALRALRRGAVVQVGQRLAMNHAAQDRKLPPSGLDIEDPVGFGQCNIVHLNFRRICASGNWLISAFSIAERAELTDMPVSTSARNA